MPDSTDMIQKARSIASTGSVAMNAKLNTQVSRGLNTNQVAENVRKVVAGRETGAAQTKEQLDAAKMIQKAKEIQGAGNGQASTNISGGLETKLAVNSKEIVGTNQVQVQRNEATHINPMATNAGPTQGMTIDLGGIGPNSVNVVA